jgi:cellulose synthase/poly-beta-1,6-N-acetylglucosamine synthase-like glycosyltransferase
VVPSAVVAEPDSAPAAGQPEVSVIIPCLNEEPSVGAVVDDAWEAIERSGRSGEVIVVDNGSTDRSAKVAVAHGARVVLGLLTLRAADGPARRGAPQAEAVDASASSDRPTVMPGSRT